MLVDGSLKLTLHLTVTSATLARNRVILTGRLSPSGRRRPTVELLGARGRRGLSFTVVGRSRLHRDGTFRVAGKPVRDAATGVYRARTTLPGGNRTYTTLRLVELR